MKALTTSKSAKEYYKRLQIKYMSTFVLYEKLKLIKYGKEQKKSMYDDKMKALYTRYESLVNKSIFGHSAIMEDCWRLEVEYLHKIYQVDREYHNRQKLEYVDRLYSIMVRDMVGVQKSIIRNSR